MDRETHALTAREAKYRSVVESSQDVILLTSQDGQIVEVMGNTMGLLGYTMAELLAMPQERQLSMLHPDDYAAVLEWWKTSRRWSANSKTQGRIQDRAGEYRWVEVSLSTLYDDTGAQTGYQCVLRDISERIKAQEALVQAEKLSALGQMAGGIAHDFNNILVSVLGYADKALADLEEDPASLRADLLQILVGANDAAEAVRRLQSLYRRGNDTSDFSPLQLDDLVSEVLALTEPTWKDLPQVHGITVQVETHLTTPAMILGNASELRRVFRNLVANAIEAMPSGGRLSISTRRDQDMTVVDVSDTGIGMSEEQRQRLFEPFFTTKPSTGSGLGLTVSRSIVKRHGGDIYVSSEPGQGTTISVRLPVVPLQAATAADGAAHHFVEVQTASPLPEHLRTLIVDDENPIRELLRRLMEREGHIVTVVGSGREALELLDQQSFDLLITDLGMPDVTGRDVAARAAERQPSMPVILSTGWGDTITPEQVREMHVAALLAKPFTRQKLLDALRRAIAGQSKA